MTQLHPKELLEHSVEVHRHQYTKKNPFFYFFLLSILVGLSLVLPLTDFEKNGALPGVIQDNDEAFIIEAPYSARVRNVRIKERAVVQKGDTLVEFDSRFSSLKNSLIRQQSDSLRYRIAFLESHVAIEKSNALDLTDSILNSMRKDLENSLKMLAILKEIQNDLKKELGNKFLITPVGGRIEGILDLRSGTVVSQGDPLFKVFPETILVADLLEKEEYKDKGIRREPSMISRFRVGRRSATDMCIPIGKTPR